MHIVCIRLARCELADYNPAYQFQWDFLTQDFGTALLSREPLGALLVLVLRRFGVRLALDEELQHLQTSHLSYPPLTGVF